MDTKTFLKTILPSRGIIFLAEIKPRPGNPKGDATIHTPVADAEDAADKARELDIDKAASNIYFAMATFKEVKHKTKTLTDGREFTYVVGRSQDNASHVKCLWQDIDVGKTDTYQTREEALEGLKLYCSAVGLPAPLIVSSGYGLHTYWPFTEEIAADEWDAIAKYQRAAWKHLGVKFDAAADADCARVLRVPGTRNKKPGKEPRAVKVVRAENTPLPAMEYKRKLRGYCEANNLMEQIKLEVPSFLKGAGNLNGMVPEYPDSYASIAVQHCKQMQQFARTGGDAEPVWYANLGVLKHCKDGEHYAHLWSSEHDGYDTTQTQEKLDQWTAGPTTCDRFKELAAHHCEGCQHTCRSPVQLGVSREVEVPVAPEVVEATPEDTVPTTDKPQEDESIFGWPAGFGYRHATETIYAKVEIDGIIHESNVARPMFYPTKVLRMEDDTYALHCVMHVRGTKREFELPLKACADPRSLKAALYAKQVYVMNDKLAQQYVSVAADNMRRLRDEIQTYQQQGWQHDFKAFLLGDHLITADDEIKIVRGKWLKSHDMSIFGQEGSREAWVEGIDELYNIPHAEPHQLAIGNAFGSILNPLLRFNEWKGIPLALTSSKSGYSKSTVFKLAHSIYCQQKSRTMSIVEDSTAKAILNRASAMNNLPFLLDEVTKYLKDPAAMSDTLYALSNGGPRDGLNSDGTSRDLPPGWCGSFGITGNRGVLHQLTESKVDPEATQMRVFEIDLESYPRIATMDEGTPEYKAKNDTHQLLTQHLLETSYGVVGREWIRWVIKHREEVEAKLREVSFKLRKLMKGDATKERFYYHWATCTIVGLYFARKLGLVRFNVTHLMHWIVAHVTRLRENIQEYRDTPEDHFANMMSTLIGRLIVTKHFDHLDMRHGNGEMSVLPVNRTPISGRMVLGDEKERAKLYITSKAVMQWCQESGVSYTAFRREALKHGLVRLGTAGVNRATGTVKIAIGKGVPGYQNLGSPTCFEFDADRAAAIIPMPDANNTDVIHLNRGTA